MGFTLDQPLRWNLRKRSDEKKRRKGLIGKDLRTIYAFFVEGDDTMITARRAKAWDVLASEYANCSRDELEEIFGAEALEDIEDFWRSLQSFGNQAGQFIQRAGPGAATGALGGAATGAALGPYGALIGGALGAVAGGAQSYMQSQSRPAPGAAPSPMATPMATPMASLMAAPNPPAAPLSSGANPLASDLLRALLRPETLQALLAASLGSQGARSTRVGGHDVPVAAFMNMISVLANQAAAVQNGRTTAEEVPSYLCGPGGELKVDPASPAERAQALLQALEEQSGFQWGEEEEDGFIPGEEWHDAEWGEDIESEGPWGYMDDEENDLYEEAAWA